MDQSTATQDNEKSSEITPEGMLWMEVVKLFLYDLDALCTILYDEITPQQKDLILEAFSTRLLGNEYWRNKVGRQLVVKQKARIKREIESLKHTLNSPWFNNICELANVNVGFIKNTAQRMLNNELRMSKKKSMADIRTITRIRKVSGRRPRILKP